MHMYTLLPEFLTPVECQEIIDQAETAGLHEATMFDRDGKSILRSDYRNNDRFIFDDAVLAVKLYARFAPENLSHIQDGGVMWKPTGLNERFKVYRYDPEQYFAMHCDHPFVRNENEQSFVTVLIALNDSYTGGDTNFLAMPVAHKTGQAVIFPHYLLHEGEPIESGRKYMLRTDVMYRRV